MPIDVVLSVRLFLIATALGLGLLSVLTFNRRDEAPQAFAFALLTLAAMLYTFGYSGEVAQTTPAAAYLWLKFEYLGVPWIPGLWLLAACRHNRLKVPVVALFIIPAITFVAMFTNDRFHLLYASMSMVQRGPFHVMVLQRGPVAMLANTYLLASFFIGVWIYVRAYRESADLFRKQGLLLQVCSLVPICGYFIYLAGYSPYGLDISPVSLAVSALLYYVALTTLGLVDVAPLARHLIFTSMRDAVVVVDHRLRLLDFNPAARHLLPSLSEKQIGSPVATVFHPYPGLSKSLIAHVDCELTLNLSGDPDDDLTLELRMCPLIVHGRVMGHAAILADTTAQGRLREELRLHAETDTLTGIANRRRFHQALEVECTRYHRYRVPFSLLLLDIDHFKTINDRFGHPAGDAVLLALSERLNVCLRESDLLARYGGEEFALLLVQTGHEEALRIAERIRQTVVREPFLVERTTLTITVSIGLATQNEGDFADQVALVKRADVALYEAKAGGRNRVAVSEHQEAGGWIDRQGDLRPM